MKKNYLIFIFFLIGIFIWTEIYLPKNFQLGEEKLFSVEKGQSLFQISQYLEKEGLIKNKFFFNLYVVLKGSQKKLRAGEYSLSSSESINRIAEKIISGDIAKIVVTIPEGFTLNQIQERLSPFPNVTKSFLVTLMVGNFKKEFQFLEDAPDNATLEGFLFPDTYQFSFRANIEEIVRKMLENFDKKLIPELREEIKKQRKTVLEIITMASLIEKEVSKNEDKELVSGILWKRLKNNFPLQVDATITYITGKKTTGISIEETKINSLFNTYKYLGLPPGPICNPGIDSIKAAIYPKNSDYWYYLSTPEGKTIFSKTLEEHNIAKEKYLR